MKTFVLGDTHGGYKGLIQVLERSGFDYDNDTLICLGDVTDGWPEVAECIEHLLTIKNLICLKGNHDDWVLEYLKQTPNLNGTPYGNWYYQGGKATKESYDKHPYLIDKHLEFLGNTKNYYLDDKNRLFIHAGFDVNFEIDEQRTSVYYWDRTFWSNVGRGFMGGTEKFNEIYIGHTPTISNWKHGKPVNIGNVWNMDTGATYMGKLSMMNIDTKELFQSDPVFMLYPEHKGRNGVLLANDPDWNKWGLFVDDNI